MKCKDAFKLRKDAYTLLVEGALRSIPFNVFVATLLAIDFFYNGTSSHKVLFWWLCIVFVSLIRWFYSLKLIKESKQEVNEVAPSNVFLFFFYTLLMGIVWGSCYLILLPFQSDLQEFIIILVFGGMCAGAIASLSVYMPAYYAYIFPMFLPVIIYNYYLMNLDRIILATTFLLFILMLIVTARLNRKVAYQKFALAEQKEDLIKQLEVLSITDSLTGLYNRRHLERVIYDEYNRAKRNKYPLNIVSFDIDNFKLVNDTFGHPYGDKFLIGTAELLKHTLSRSNDIVFRFGGDEFCAIIANLTLADVKSLCKTIQTKFRLIRPPTENSNVDICEVLDSVTLSIGIAHIPYDYSLDMDAALVAVDIALYQAKKDGKNKIVAVDLS